MWKQKSEHTEKQCKTNIMLVDHLNCSHIWVMLPKETLWDFKVLLSLAGISPCPRHFPGIDLEPSEWRREKESWITTESKADGLIRAQQQLGSKLPLGGRTSGQEVPKRKPLDYPEALWSLKVREAHPRGTFYCSVLFYSSGDLLGISAVFFMQVVGLNFLRKLKQADHLEFDNFL